MIGKKNTMKREILVLSVIAVFAAALLVACAVPASAVELPDPDG